MDKNTIIGIVLMVLVLVGFSYFNTPSEEEIKQQKERVERQQKEAEEAKKAALAQKAKQTQVVAVDTTSIFRNAVTGDATPVVLENKEIKVSINPKGGNITRVELKNYKNYQDFNNGKQDASLLLYNDSTTETKLEYQLGGKRFFAGDYYFKPENLTKNSVDMVLADETGTRRLVYTYKLKADDSFLIDFNIHAENIKADLGEGIAITWQDTVKQQEKGWYFENRYSTLTYKDTKEGTEVLNEVGNDEETAENDVDWIAFKNQYFSSVLLSEQPMKKGVFESKEMAENSGKLKHFRATAQIPFDPSNAKGTQLQYYFGPNKYLYLRSLDADLLGEKSQDLEELVDLGWPLFKWINRFFTVYVFDWLTKLGLHMALVLLLITILLRVIVYYPNKKSYLSSAKMRVLKPKVDELNAKYPNKEDAMKKQQEMMTLYSQYGVSPMGGCLPMLIQMPIWIAMFNFVPNAFELRQQSFLWAEDLSTYDSVISWGADVWLIGDHLSLFCLLFCVTNVVYSLIMMRQQQSTMSSEQQQQMKIMQWMMLLMPVFFFFMFNKYSSGLNFYYFISLLFGALTMWYLRRSTDDAKLLAELEANYKNNKNNPEKRPTGMAARLAKLQEQQEELRQKQAEINKRKGKK